MPVMAPSLSRLNFLHRPFSPSLFYRSLRTLNHSLNLNSKQIAPSSLFSSMPYSKFPKKLCKDSSFASSVDDEGSLVILGIETSCDDTAAAVVRSNGEILSQVVSSQADLLAQYGGVAPKMAEEAHFRVIDQVVKEALDKAKIKERDLSAVAVTIGPGLSLCLRVGVLKARKIAGNFNLPMVGVHHMEAHALVVRLIERKVQFPFMALLISGGHNLIVLASDLGQYLQLGTTIDDAIGEAYDKTAKWLGLDLRRSGGRAIEELALEGDEKAVKFASSTNARIVLLTVHGCRGDFPLIQRFQ